MKTTVNALKIAILILILASSSAIAQQKAKVTSKEKNGLTTVTFETNKGNITVHLPSNVHAGDIISGTVFAEPKGKNEKQKAKNKNILCGYIYEMEETKAPVNQKKQKWELPEVVEDITKLILKDPKGNILASAEIPVKKIPRPVITPGPIKISDFKIPFYIRPGEIEKLSGNYDGDFFTSVLKIQDKPIEILAESPEGLFFETPEDIIGPIDMELQEGELTLNSQTNVIDLELYADQLTLSKGDNTKVHISVSGMEGLDEEVPLEILNLTPGNINIEGGNEQKIVIHPEEIPEEGTVQKDLDVVATGTGGFSVLVNIVPPNYTDKVEKNPLPEIFELMDSYSCSDFKELQLNINNNINPLLNKISNSSYFNILFDSEHVKISEEGNIITCEGEGWIMTCIKEYEYAGFGAIMTFSFYQEIEPSCRICPRQEELDLYKTVYEHAFRGMSWAVAQEVFNEDELASFNVSITCIQRNGQNVLIIEGNCIYD